MLEEPSIPAVLLHVHTRLLQQSPTSELDLKGTPLYTLSSLQNTHTLSRLHRLENEMLSTVLVTYSLMPGCNERPARAHTLTSLSVVSLLSLPTKMRGPFPLDAAGALPPAEGTAGTDATLLPRSPACMWMLRACMCRCSHHVCRHVVITLTCVHSCSACACKRTPVIMHV